MVLILSISYPDNYYDEEKTREKERNRSHEIYFSTSNNGHFLYVEY